MSKFSASDAAFSGFTLVREHPRAVIVWGVILTVVSALETVLSIRFAGPQIEAFTEVMRDNSSDPQAAMAAFSGMAPLMMWSLPLNLAIQAFLLAAINRVVLTPQDSRNAYLRLGRDELQQLAVVVLVHLLIFGLLFASSLISAVFLAAGGVAALLGLVAFVGGGCVTIYFLVRLSLAFAMTFDTKKITLWRAFPLTKGLFALLVGAYVLAGVMALIVWLLTSVIVAAIALIVSGDFSAAGAIFQADATSLETYFTAPGIVKTLFSGLIGTLLSLILNTPAAVIYRSLKGGGAEPVEAAI